MILGTYPKQNVQLFLEKKLEQFLFSEKQYHLDDGMILFMNPFSMEPMGFHYAILMLLFFRR